METENQPGRIKDLLNELVRKANVITALLITKEGTAIEEAGDTGYLNTTAMAALVAGMFTATREVARMVGEQQFSILLQQGENRHIHISLISDSTMMVVVFEDATRIGIVRLTANQIGPEVARLLASSHDEERLREELSVPKFKEYALNLIDRIFTAK